MPMMLPGYLFELKDPPKPPTILDMQILDPYLTTIPDINVDELVELEKFIREEQGVKPDEPDEFSKFSFTDWGFSCVQLGELA